MRYKSSADLKPCPRFCIICCQHLSFRSIHIYLNRLHSLHQLNPVIYCYYKMFILLPLDHQRHMQATAPLRSSSCEQHFYRQIYRQSHLIPENSFQRLSTCIEINRRSLAGHLSRCIEIHRLLQRSPTASTSPVTGRNDAKKALASNDITHCLFPLIRRFFTVTTPP